MTLEETSVENSTYAEETSSNEDYMSSQGTSDTVYEIAQKKERVKPYTLRKLNSTDLFPMIKIITKIGLDELTEVFEGDAIKQLIDRVSSKEDTVEGKELIVGVGVALKLVNKILEHVPHCEAEIYTLLSRVSGMEVEEIKNFDIDIFMEMLLEFIMREEFTNFFRVASQYINRLG